MILDLLTFDPGYPCESPQAYADEVVRLVRKSWEDGADLVLLPEFTWMGLEARVQKSPDDASIYHTVSCTFWGTLMPGLRTQLSQPGKAVILGSVPFADPHTHRVFNRAPILNGGQLSHQDKLHLTPWEKDFSPGGILYLWEFQGFRIAVVICLDIEIPEISARLRSDGVDLILCPSATETILGVERVDRCASARAVELGCHVAVAHLTGEAQSELIDKNIGRLAHYAPSQASFRHHPRWTETEVWTAGQHSLRVTLEKQALILMRRMHMETNPSHFGKEMAGHFTIHQVES
ncbi:putative amidohydrolase [Prosthecobacter fusiformis]|uniref:Putative amidohydrolase n=1 Tax=Prosthecobacter fusiformis TaxID=48464 RepID=A0A4R7RKS6_9BACT|nr:nitrilase-related carbon-nitrogen hydrolase [Prosthecobacter fusiformis]TDU64033.1 putative amidohydrolase [Prosthecobacter fusiformis]